MTLGQLREQYEEAYRIIRRERDMRLRVFRNKPSELKAKMAEMDTLLGIVRGWKDELKQHVEPEYEQPTLMDVPSRDVYR